MKQVEAKAYADFGNKCIACGASPTVVLVEDVSRRVHANHLCGPCCFGTAECVNVEEWACGIWANGRPTT